MAILDATETLLRNYAPAEITTRLIAEASGLPIGSIYRYFTNVDDLLSALFERMNAGTIDALRRNETSADPNWRANVDMIFERLHTMHSTHPAYGALMVHVDMGESENDEISQLLGAQLRQTLPQLDAAQINDITRTVIALLDGVERRLFRLAEADRAAALDQARIAISAYLSHYIDAP